MKDPQEMLRQLAVDITRATGRIPRPGQTIAFMWDDCAHFDAYRRPERDPQNVPDPTIVRLPHGVLPQPALPNDVALDQVGIAVLGIQRDEHDQTRTLHQMVVYWPKE